MVQVIEGDNSWQDAFRKFGSGLSEGYMDRSDENSIQEAIKKLGPNPDARKVLDALTNAKTYRPESKQRVLQNYLGQDQFEELKRHNKINEEASGLKSELDKLKQTKKEQQELNDSLALIDFSELEQEEKDVLRNKVKEGAISLDAIKDVLKPNKEAIDNKHAAEDLKKAQKVFDELSALIPEVGLSNLPASKFGMGASKAYSKFTSLNGGLESALVEMVNRGTLSNTRFNYIKNDLLPQPSDTQAAIRGKLEGLAVILELDPSALTGSKPGKQTMSLKGEKNQKKRSLSDFGRK